MQTIPHGQGSPRVRQPDGSMKQIPYDEAVDWMAKALLKAKKPLIYGFGSTNCEGMSAAGRVAEKAGAVLDNCASICHGPSFLAMFDNGYPSCTLGEVKNRADCVIFWGMQPDACPPAAYFPVLHISPGFFHHQGAYAEENHMCGPQGERHFEAGGSSPDAGPGA